MQRARRRRGAVGDELPQHRRLPRRQLQHPAVAEHRRPAAAAAEAGRVRRRVAEAAAAAAARAAVAAAAAAFALQVAAAEKDEASAAAERGQRVAGSLEQRGGLGAKREVVPLRPRLRDGAESVRELRAEELRGAGDDCAARTVLSASVSAWQSPQ